MALPTQTWRVAGPYSVRSDTNDNRITDINSAFAANGADSNGLWINDLFSVAGTVKYLTIKRKGSPSGILGTFRSCIFVCSTAVATSTGVNYVAAGLSQQAALQIHVGVGTDIGATAIDTSNTASVEYWSKAATGWTGGFPLSGAASNPSSGAVGSIGTTGTMYIVECDTMCAIVLVNTTQMAWCVVGECIEDLSTATGVWAGFGSAEYGAGALASFGLPVLNGVPTTSPFPVFNNAGYNTNNLNYSIAVGCLRRSGATYDVGRIHCGMTHYTAGGAVLETGGSALICPLLVGYKLATTVATNDYGLLGLARQIRMGPMATGGIKRIFNGVPALRGYIAAPNSATATQGVVFDNSP